MLQKQSLPFQVLVELVDGIGSLYPVDALKLLNALATGSVKAF